MSRLGIIALTPAVAVLPEETTAKNNEFNEVSERHIKQSLPEAAIAISAYRAGATGILNCEFTRPSPVADASIAATLAQLANISGAPAKAGRFGIKFDISQIEAMPLTMSEMARIGQERAGALTIVLAALADTPKQTLKRSIDSLHERGAAVFIETLTREEALKAEQSGADAVIAKGHEAGGRVGEQTTFVLVQQCITTVKIPVYAEGGIGLHTAAACYAAGAAGVVLDSQLYLTPDSPLPLAIKQKSSAMDGTETTLVGSDGTGIYRIFSRLHHGHFDLDRQASENATPSLSVKAQTRDWLINRLIDNKTHKPLDRTYIFGQDIAFAADLTRRFTTVAGIIDAIAVCAEEQANLASANRPLRANAPLAISHATKYPLVQGAMTRVSDCAGFALKVAEGGALPFLALALMRQGEVDTLLSETSKLLGARSWGVGLLGFVPHQLRQEQLEAISKYKPPYALIAGGRPDQAKQLDDMGIKTYLHVPSPLLLESFIEMGSRRFIFEGRECGGHVGPRSSFVLWEAMVEKLLAAIGPKEDASAYHVLFAGGVHDGLSAAMVSALAAPLAARGVCVGALMGTAYLFTKEAVETGAIVKRFQESALSCAETVLLETGPGHAIRCIDSPYKRTFDERRGELVLQGKSRDEVREELELMNLGRLRVASKGLTRTASLDRQSVMSEINNKRGERKETLSAVSAEQQWSEGMYMIGQVAAMHDSVCTIEQLHEEVSSGCDKRLELFAASRQNKLVTPKGESSRAPGEPIAIVGMSCLFPKASDVDTYWQNILTKVDAITEIPIEHWDWRNYYDKNPLARDKIASKWGGFLEDIRFDATRYGIPPSSLSSIDPMQLLLLEVTRMALDDAGYSERHFDRRKSSVIVANAGHGPITALYSLRSMLGWKLADLDESIKTELEDALPEWTEDTFPGYLGNVVAGRVANRFDLGGINFTVDAACGSSLAALYVAISELRQHNSDVVLLGATDTHNQPGDYLSFSKTHALSQRGHCRTFDATADGIVISEGMAMVVLKRLSDAERDGDKIYAVIKGIGGSSDGRDLSLTAPRPAGQVLALNRAYEDAGVSPATVTLVEAHGTGTVAGDKAEIEALRQVYEKAGTRTRSCAVGSVKTMIGHTKCAAGLASLIKVAKALHHKVLPPTIGVTTPNPSCQFETSPFYVNSETRPWINPRYQVNGEASTPRRAGVSAFGFGGTNFHTIVEEYVPAARENDSASSPRWAAELFVLKGRTRNDLLRALESLQESARKWATSREADQSALRTLAYWTYLKQLDRAVENENKEAGKTERAELLTLSCVASSLDDLIEKINRAKEDLSDSAKKEIRDPRGIYFIDSTDPEKAAIVHGKIAYLFSGQGSQHVDMIKDLATEFDDVRKTFELANSVLSGKIEGLLTDYVYPAPAFSDDERKTQHNRLTDTQIAQPAVGAADLAIHKLLGRFGLAPDMVAGHSYGELVALCAAGALSETDLIRISHARGEILSQSNGDERGSMAAFAASVAQANKVLAQCPGVTLANINSPGQCVVSGEADEVRAAIELAKKAGIQAKEIAVSQAFHSKHMLHAQAPLRKALQEFSLSAPRIPVFSNVDACPYGESNSALVERLVDHIVSPVDFVTEVERMHESGATIFLEVGPGSVLTVFADAILQARGARCLTLSSDRSGRSSLVHLLHTLGQLAAYGQPIDIERLFSGRISSSDCLASKAVPPTESGHAHKRELTYLVNSARVQKLSAQKSNATEPAKIHSGGQKVVSPPPAARTQNTNMGASVSAQIKPTLSTSLESGRAQKAAPAHQSVATSSGPGNGNNGHHPAPQLKLTAPNERAAQRPAAPMPTPFMPQAAGQRNVDQVMLQFQQTMLQMTNSFLETQQNVMLAYLNARSGNQNGTTANTGSHLKVDGLTASNGNGNGHQQGMFAQTLAPLAAPATYSGNGNGDYATASYSASDNEAANHYATADGMMKPEFPSHSATDRWQDESTGPGEATADNGSDPEALIAALLDIVSERTGYPSDMLDPTLDLEADLGIDSIKRVEILNSFRKILPEERQRELEGGIEALAGTKTLQGIMDWIRNGAGQTGAAKEAMASSTKPDSSNGAAGNNAPSPANASEKSNLLKRLEATQKPNPQEMEPAQSSISRALVQLSALEPVAVSPRKLAAGAWIIVDSAGEESTIALQLTQRLSDATRKIVRIQHKPGATKVAGLSADLTDERQTQALIKQIKAEHGSIAALVHLLALTEKRVPTETAQESLSPLYSLFNLSRALEADLNRRDQATLVAAAHKIGGLFGLEAAPVNVAQAGLPGVVKSLAKEWPMSSCKSIDFQLDVANAWIVDALAGELLNDDPRIEVAYGPEQRFGLEIVASPLEQSAPLKKTINLSSDSVLLVTGGARGITAEVARQLAATYRPTLVVVGKTPRSTSPESEATKGLTSQREIKAAIIETFKQEKKQVSVAEIENSYQRTMRNREIAANLEALENLGAKVEYHAVDVKDAGSFGALLDSIYERHGRIDGVIHGAGIIEDAYIKDKTPDSFRRVVETKVLSAMTLCQKLRLESLQFMFLFSSVVGRTGNAGQSDYVAANEIVNKLALALNRKAQSRIASLMWGPWRGGMAQPELEAIFAKYGWAMIDPIAGQESFMQELLRGDKEAVEVLLVAEVPCPPQLRGARLSSASGTSPAPGLCEFSLELDTSNDLYLNHHTFDGVPVMPMAMAVELLMEAAQSAYPGYRAESVHDLDIPSGIVFESASKTISITIALKTRSENDITVMAVLGVGAPMKRPNFKARIMLVKETLGAGLSYRLPEQIPAQIDPQQEHLKIEAPMASPPTVQKIYQEWFFHGPLFQGITEISALGSSGVFGSVASSDPASSLASTSGEAWTIDPLLLDSAMQLAGTWARQHLEITVLPTGFSTLHKFTQRYTDRLHVRVFVSDRASAIELTCDLAVYNSDGTLAFVIEKLGGIGSKALNRLANQTAANAH